MTFWRLCSGIQRTFNFILWVVFKVGKHPENTVYWICGFIVGCALTKWQWAFFTFCCCSWQTVAYCSETHDTVISSVQRECNLWKTGSFFEPLMDFLREDHGLWLKCIAGKFSLLKTFSHLSSLLSRDINRKAPWGSAQQLNFHFYLFSFSVSLGL